LGKNCFVFLFVLWGDTRVLPYTISHPYQSSTASYTPVPSAGVLEIE
jgi:hypothetical protein